MLCNFTLRNQRFCYAGTCTGVVVKTGDRTVMGRIAQLTSNIVEESGLEHSVVLYIYVCVNVGSYH